MNRNYRQLKMLQKHNLNIHEYTANNGTQYMPVTVTGDWFVQKTSYRPSS